MNPLCIAVADPTRDADLAALAARLGAQVVTAADAADCVVARVEHGLAVRARLATGDATVRADFAQPRHGLSRRQSLLARAVGDARDGIVVDATAGLGRDTHELAVLGYRVLACERHPVLAFLLADALRTSALPITLHAGDAIAALHALTAPAHAVCLDPMFPPRDKSAQVKKEAQVLQMLVGHEDDTGALFAAAWQHASRVVVKRPRLGATLAQDPSFTVAGKAVRFDVYLTAGRARPAFSARTPAP